MLPPPCLRVVAARLRPCSALVVSHHSDGLLLSDRAGLLRPAHDHGVHHVSTCCEQAFPRCSPTLQSLAPRPQRRCEAGFPSSHRGVRHRLAACCHAASRSPVPLPSRRCSRSPDPTVADRLHLPQARPQGLAPRSKPCPAEALPLHQDRCSPGLVPPPPHAARCFHLASHRQAGEGVVKDSYVKDRSERSVFRSEPPGHPDRRLTVKQAACQRVPTGEAGFCTSAMGTSFPTPRA